MKERDSGGWLKSSIAGLLTRVFRFVFGQCKKEIPPEKAI